jgi:hypothetical protein
MLFSVQHDPEHVQAFARDCILGGNPLPDFIRDAPELLPGLSIYLNAFWDLSTCRQMGMGLGPIPWTNTREYCTILGGDEQFQEEFHYLIRRLDQAYLNWASESSKEKPK